MFAVTLEPLFGGAACGHRRLSHQMRRCEGFTLPAAGQADALSLPCLWASRKGLLTALSCLLLQLLAAQKWIGAAILSS